MKKVLSLLLVVFSTLGILDTSYLLYEKLNGTIPPCSSAFKCNDVLTSEWSSIGPVPLSLLGLLFYSAFLTLVIIYFLEKESLVVGRFKFQLPTLLLMWGTIGAAFSMYLVFIMGVVIQAWCLYCLLSAVNSTILFLLSVLLNHHLKKKET
jgi:uncharacterized membrane protein